MKSIKLIITAIILSTSFCHSQIVTIYDTLQNWDGKGFNVEKSEGMMKDGKKSGVWKTWDEKGQLLSVGEYVPYTDGMITFVDETGFNFDSTTQKKSYSKYLSLKKGEWKSFYKNGQLMEECTYLPYQKIVVDAVDDSNNPGQFVFSLVAPYGTLEGKVKQYSKEGKLQMELTYKAGKLMEEKQY